MDSKYELPEIPEKYLLSISRDDWPELLAGWRDLIPRGALPWLLTKFGELFVCQTDGKIGMLQISAFTYSVVAKSKTDFQELLVDTDKMTEWFLAPLVDHLEGSGKSLRPEYCFSFTTPLGLGGKVSPENVMSIPIREHFCLWGEVFQKIKNLPDGSRVQLKSK